MKWGGVAVNWAIYGSSGYLFRQNGLVTSTYLHRAGIDFELTTRIKSIIDPRKTAYFEHAHFPVYKTGHFAVNTQGHTVKGAISDEVDYSVMRVNHYITKSKEEWVKKRKRGQADTGYYAADDEIEKSFLYHDRNEVFDDSMLKYADKIREAIDFRKRSFEVQ